MLPTFIIAGAGKSGTTSLWKYLKQHPDIFMTENKEPLFFTQVVGRDQGANDRAPSSSGNYNKGLKWYEDLFAGCTSQKHRGEASTMYINAPDSPSLIKKHVPDVKLIFILREPVSRSYSHYWQEIKSGHRLPPFAEMHRSGHPRLQRYLYNSRYKTHLTNFLKEFDREQILVLLQDDLKRNPEALIRSIYSFLGVDATFIPDNLGHRHNPSSLPRIRILQRIIYHSSRSRLKELLPSPLRRLLNKIKIRVRAMNLRPYAYPPMPEDIQKALAPEFGEDVAFIELLTGKSLDSWKTHA